MTSMEILTAAVNNVKSELEKDGFYKNSQQLASLSAANRVLGMVWSLLTDEQKQFILRVSESKSRPAE